MNKYIVYGLLAAILVVSLLCLRGTTVQLGAEGDTNLTNLVIDGTLAVGGGAVLKDNYATSSVVDTGALTASSVAGTAATSSFSLILRTVGNGSILPEVGMRCLVIKNDAASSTKLEAWEMKVTAVDLASGLKNASATLTYFNYGAMTDYGLANITYVCPDYD